MTMNPTVKVNMERWMRGRTTITLNVRYTRVWKVRARLWLATLLIRFACWIAQQNVRVTEETQP